MDEPTEPPRPNALVGLAIVFYGLMAAVGLIVMSFADIAPGAAIFGAESDPRSTDNALHALLGAGTGLGVVLVSWLARNLKALDHLKRELGGMLGGQTTGRIAILAVTSAIGEELLFRGALQPVLGFWPTTILFGFLHGGHSVKLWLWAVFALASGILLGWLADFTGSLLAPILAHLTVNYWNLHALAGDAPADEVA